MKQTKHIIVSGKVQGVSYRANAKKMAEHFNICGWVKNIFEGKVEIVACGEEIELNQFITWCKKGPSLARISGITVEDIACQTFNTFNIVK